MTGNCHVRFLEGWETATSPRLLDYCSCERVFNPSLIGKPVGVLSNNDGCIIALTPELKNLGVAMGTPAHLVQNILKENNVALFSSNYELYGDMSARIMGTLQHFSPFVEVYSIDEALTLKIQIKIQVELGLPEQVKAFRASVGLCNV
jgi:nucleotidyltransferase/DNA polymerase involved in DNA repair